MWLDVTCPSVGILLTHQQLVVNRTYFVFLTSCLLLLLLIHFLQLLFLKTYPDSWASLIAQLVKNLPAMQETPVQFLVWKDTLEKG